MLGNVRAWFVLSAVSVRSTTGAAPSSKGASMSFLDRLKSFFSSGSQEAADAASPAPAPPADPAGMPTSEPQPPEPQAEPPAEPEERAE
jgi:hypothetical protein